MDTGKCLCFNHAEANALWAICGLVPRSLVLTARGMTQCFIPRKLTLSPAKYCIFISQLCFIAMPIMQITEENGFPLE